MQRQKDILDIVAPTLDNQNKKKEHKPNDTKQNEN